MLNSDIILLHKSESHLIERKYKRENFHFEKEKKNSFIILQLRQCSSGTVVKHVSNQIINEGSMFCFRQELNRLQEAGIVDTIERNGERSKLKFNKKKEIFVKIKSMK